MTTHTNPWNDFFNKTYSPTYDREVFTQNTAAEIEFLVRELDLQPGQRLLDVGCGTGRHAIPLAQHPSPGLQVTGVDISPNMLAVARDKANTANVELTLVECDAQNLAFAAEFDVAICLCEGGLTLLSRGDDPFTHDVNILTGMWRALKPGGVMITTVLNACRILRAVTDEDCQAGRFDLNTQVEFSRETVAAESGEREIVLAERYYTPAEFTFFLKHIGFERIEIFGGTAGSWNKGPVQLDEMEIMAIARRPDTAV